MRVAIAGFNRQSFHRSNVPLCRFCDIHLSLYRKRAKMTTASLIPPSTAGGDMNRLHQWLCRLDQWRSTIRQRVPWVFREHGSWTECFRAGPRTGFEHGVLLCGPLAPDLQLWKCPRRRRARLTAHIGGGDVEVIEGKRHTTDAIHGQTVFGGPYQSPCFIMFHLANSKTKSSAKYSAFSGPAGFFWAATVFAQLVE